MVLCDRILMGFWNMSPKQMRSRLTHTLISLRMLKCICERVYGVRVSALNSVLLLFLLLLQTLDIIMWFVPFIFHILNEKCCFSYFVILVFVFMFCHVSFSNICVFLLSSAVFILSICQAKSFFFKKKNRKKRLLEKKWNIIA